MQSLLPRISVWWRTKRPLTRGLVTSEAAALFDQDGREVLYSKDAFEQLYPASTTKIMTALVALKYGNLADQVTVTEGRGDHRGGSHSRRH